MNSFEKKLQTEFQKIPPSATPGFVLQVYQKGKLKADIKWGKTWTYYDLASLTKILFTTPMVIRAVGEKKLSLNQGVDRYIPWAKKQSVKNLLNHTAGNVDWLPFYKKIDPKLSVEGRLAQVENMIRSTPAKKQNQSVYSDLDFLLLGFVLESVYEKNWNSLWTTLNDNFIENKNLFFHPDHQLVKKRSLFAPTEKCPWRRKVLVGEVHDDNAWAMGGVAPHAGLFGTVDGVSQVALKFHKLYLGQSSYLKSEVFKKFIRRSLPVDRGDWGLGFMLPTVGGASCGRYFSPKSYGHTGFTGTSLWIDPSRDLIVTLLSNRVSPRRDNVEFRKWRPRIHDWVVEGLS